MKICEFCGIQVSDEATFCPACEAGLDRLIASLPREGDYAHYRRGLIPSIAVFRDARWRDTVNGLALTQAEVGTTEPWIRPGDGWSDLVGDIADQHARWLTYPESDRAYIPGERRYFVRKATS